MNRERAKELLPIIQAFAEGKTIQVKNPTLGWYDLDNNPMFLSDDAEYRIKPEPMEIWVNQHKNSLYPDFYMSKKEAMEDVRNLNNFLYVAKHFREVIE